MNKGIELIKNRIKERDKSNEISTMNIKTGDGGNKIIVVICD